MRVGLNAAFLGKSHNGISTYTRGLIKALKARHRAGDEEYVIYTSDASIALSEANFQWRRTPQFLSADRGTLGNCARLFWTQCILPGLLRRDHIDVLLSPLPEIPAVSKTPRVVVVHDLIPLFYPEETPRLTLYFRFGLRFVLRRASRLVAISEHTKQDVVRTFGIDAENVAVVPNGVEEVYFSEDEVRDHPSNCPDEYFLFVGACVPRKNPLGVIRAYAQVHTRLNLKLVLVMSGSGYLNEVKRTVEDFGLGDRVVFYSALPQHQMLFLYRHATALVFLSEYEGFGYPAAEAIAAGTPAIVSASTSLPEVVGDAGVVVSPEDSGAVARAMIKLALDEPARGLLRERGLLHRKMFQWPVVAEKLVSVLLTVKNGRG